MTGRQPGVGVQASAALTAAAQAATQAPSVHNSQPWRFLIGHEGLDLLADWSRQLPAIDPSGRDLLLSCGAALGVAEVSLAAAGVRTACELMPEPHDPTCLARLTVLETGVERTANDLALAAAVPYRHTNRRPFLALPVSPGQVDALQAAGGGAGTWVAVVRREEERLALAVLLQRSEQLQHKASGYDEEVARWTSVASDATEGIPAYAVPASADGWSRGDLPLRDLDAAGIGGLPAATRSNRQQTLLVLGTDTDTQADQVLAGAALVRVLLTATSFGLAASVFSGIVEVPSTRARLQAELGLVGHPQILLRVGVAEDVPATPRRPVTEVSIDTRPPPIQ